MKPQARRFQTQYLFFALIILGAGELFFSPEPHPDRPYLLLGIACLGFAIMHLQSLYRCLVAVQRATGAVRRGRWLFVFNYAARAFFFAAFSGIFLGCVLRS